LFVSFLFPFLWLPNVCVVNALIKGEIEDHVWFEDRWMGASLFGEPVWPVWVTGRRKLRRRGHASGSQGLHRGYAKCGRQASVWWCYKDKFPKCPWWACILV
jgi:hypothetical protein